jgi:hypothetical protein
MIFMGLLRELGLSSAAGRGACSLRVVEYDYAPASTTSGLFLAQRNGTTPSWLVWPCSVIAGLDPAIHRSS